jgi:hypothetical protein
MRPRNGARERTLEAGKQMDQLMFSSYPSSAGSVTTTVADYADDESWPSMERTSERWGAGSTHARGYGRKYQRVQPRLRMDSSTVTGAPSSERRVGEAKTCCVTGRFLLGTRTSVLGFGPPSLSTRNQRGCHRCNAAVLQRQLLEC